MATPTRRITTVRQLELMVNFMGSHKQLAVGRLCGKEYAAAAQRLWMQLADILNAEGPSRSWKEWSKIWVEAKSKVRKKLIDERAGMSGTGGGPHTSCLLTPLQEAIASIIGRDVGPIPGARIQGQVPMSHDDSIAKHNTQNTENQDEDNTEMKAAEETSHSIDLSLYDHQYEVPHAAVTIDVVQEAEAGPSMSALRVPGTPQPRVGPPVPETAHASTRLITPRRPRRRPSLRPRQGHNIENSNDRVRSESSLSTVQDTLARVELLKAETGRQLAVAAVQQANAATQHAEAAMRQAQAWERNADALLALANAVSMIAQLHASAPKLIKWTHNRIARPIH